VSTTPKLLLIDDDALVGQLVTMLVAAFKENAFTVDHVRDYAGGLEKLLSGGYSLCLLDYRLGDGDGLQLLREAKAKKCSTPIILLTGDNREETDEAAMENGAADFIVKSDLKPESLERSIDYAIKTATVRQKLEEKPKGPAV
jgi:DNA-binding response OmpR family regulator